MAIRYDEHRQNGMVIFSDALTNVWFVPYLGWRDAVCWQIEGLEQETDVMMGPLWLLCDVVTCFCRSRVWSRRLMWCLR